MDRLVVRFPRFARTALAVGMRFSSPRNPIRRDGLKRVLRSGWAAAPRKDWDLMFARYSGDVVWDMPEEFQTLGFAASYRGHRTTPLPAPPTASFASNQNPMTTSATFTDHSSPGRGGQAIVA